MWGSHWRKTASSSCPGRDKKSHGRRNSSDGGMCPCWYSTFDLCLQGEFKTGDGRYCWCAGSIKKGEVLVESYNGNRWSDHYSVDTYVCSWACGVKSSKKGPTASSRTKRKLSKRKLLSLANFGQSCAKAFAFHDTSDYACWCRGMCISFLLQSSRN